MGQRANYVLIEANKQTIHYSHWRANRIAADLYLGEKRFINFVKNCQVVNELIDDPWIEGCVIIDIAKKALHFWGLEFDHTSVIDIYLEELGKKWTGWGINFLCQQMYDVERILGIDYVSKQSVDELTNYTTEQIINDVPDFLSALTSVVIVKTQDETQVVQTGNISFPEILNFGEPVIALFKEKRKIQLPKETADGFYECMVIDTVTREILVDKNCYGVWEQVGYKWAGYKFEMGDFGYIGALKRAKIDTAELTMPPEDSRKLFLEFVEQHEPFDPQSMAAKFLKDDENVQFNPDFFDNMSPKKTLPEKINKLINQLFRIK